jgi:S1-C subfamily serine protease
MSASQVTVAEAVPPDGLVDVIADRGDGTARAGTGIVLATEGLVVTAAHVVDGTRVWVGSPDGSWSLPATVLGADDDHDVVFLQIPGITLLPARLGDPATLREGDQVSVVGNAGGLGPLSVVTARVTDLAAVIPCTAPASDNGPAPEITDLIGTDGGVVPGDSGGVLLNDQGRVVAMILAYAPALDTELAAGRGYAIPIPRVLSAAAQVVRRHRSVRR